MPFFYLEYNNSTMQKILKNSLKVFLILFFLSFSYFKAYGDEMETILKQLESLQNDIKTLGLGDDQRVVKSLQQLENALVAISTLVHGDEKAQPAAQQQAAAE